MRRNAKAAGRVGRRDGHGGRAGDFRKVAHPGGAVKAAEPRSGA